MREALVNLGHLVQPSKAASPNEGLTRAVSYSRDIALKSVGPTRTRARSTCNRAASKHGQRS